MERAVACINTRPMVTATARGMAIAATDTTRVSPDPSWSDGDEPPAWAKEVLADMACFENLAMQIQDCLAKSKQPTKPRIPRTPSASPQKPATRIPRISPSSAKTISRTRSPTPPSTTGSPAGVVRIPFRVRRDVQRFLTRCLVPANFLLDFPCQHGL